MSDMTTTIREFQRNFKSIRQRAKAGERILIRDSDGLAYSFQVTREEVPTLASAAADIIGSYQSGEGDLASHPKHFSDYGRSRASH